MIGDLSLKQGRETVQSNPNIVLKRHLTMVWINKVDVESFFLSIVHWQYLLVISKPNNEMSRSEFPGGQPVQMMHAGVALSGVVAIHSIGQR